LVDGVLEELEAALLHAAEVEEDASGLGDGEEGDEDGLDLLGARAAAEGVQITFRRAGAGPLSAARHGSTALSGSWTLEAGGRTPNRGTSEPRNRAGGYTPRESRIEDVGESAKGEVALRM